VEHKQVDGRVEDAKEEREVVEWSTNKSTGELRMQKRRGRWWSGGGEV